MNKNWLFTVCVLLIGCGGPGGPEDRAAAELVISKGGKIDLADYTVPVTALDKLPKGDFAVQQIDLNEQDVTDADLEKFAPLEDLRVLRLYSTLVTDKGVEHLTGIKTLRELELSLTNVSDAGLEKLAALKELKKLFLRGTKVTKEGVDAFKKKVPGCTVYAD